MWEGKRARANDGTGLSRFEEVLVVLVAGVLAVAIVVLVVGIVGIG